MIDKLLAKLRLYDAVDAREEQALRGVFTGTIDYGRGETIVRAGADLTSSNVLLSGYVHRFKDLSDGRRQSLELSVPGDFIDLHSFTMKRIDHDIGCIAACTLAIAPHVRLQALTETEPHLTRLLWLNTMIDAAIHREWIMSLGARSALERLAHLYCEMFARLRAVGLTDGDGFLFPLTQAELAEVLGLSLVHVNRTLRELRERGLVVGKDRQLCIRDWEGLVSLAQFDRAYLGMEVRPR